MPVPGTRPRPPGSSTLPMLVPLWRRRALAGSVGRRTWTPFGRVRAANSRSADWKAGLLKREPASPPAEAAPEAAAAPSRAASVLARVTPLGGCSERRCSTGQTALRSGFFFPGLRSRKHDAFLGHAFGPAAKRAATGARRTRVGGARWRWCAVAPALAVSLSWSRFSKSRHMPPRPSLAAAEEGGRGSAARVCGCC